MKKVLSLVCLLAIVASCLFVFASCGATPNADANAAKEKLEANGYTVRDITTGAATMFTGCKAAFIATNKNDSADIAEFYYFSNEEHAQAGFETIEALAEGSNASVSISGCVVFAGSSDAIKATN